MFSHGVYHDVGREIEEYLIERPSEYDRVFYKACYLIEQSFVRYDLASGLFRARPDALPYQVLSLFYVSYDKGGAELVKVRSDAVDRDRPV